MMSRLFKIRKVLMLACFTLPAIIPFDCAQPLLRELTPFLISGNNGFLVDVIFAAAPLVLP